MGMCTGEYLEGGLTPAPFPLWGKEEGVKIVLIFNVNKIYAKI